MDISSIVITIITGLFGLISGGSILYYRQDRKLKEVEAKRQEAELVSAQKLARAERDERQSQEWKRLYDESKEDSREKLEQIKALTDDRDNWRMECANRDVLIVQKEMEIQRLTFYKCDLLECTNRRPPFLQSKASQNDEE